MVVPDPDVLHRLTRVGVELWSGLARTVPGVQINPTGCLWLASNADEVDVLARMRAQFAAYESGCEWLDPEGLSATEPALADDLRAGLLYPLDGVLVPMRALAALLREARRLGARLRSETEVIGLQRDRCGVRSVSTSRGAIATRAVVIASGVHSPQLTERCGLGALPVFPRRGELAITVAGDCPIRHQLLEVGYLRSTASGAPPAVDAGDWALNVQPQAAGTCLIGSTRQFAGYREEVDPTLLRRSLERAVRFVPALARARVARTWAGLRPASIDQLPWIGPVEGVPGLQLATGHEGLGITLAAVTGELILAAVEGRSGPVPLDPFLPRLDRWRRDSGAAEKSLVAPS